jgi:hypothetical protein
MISCVELLSGVVDGDNAVRRRRTSNKKRTGGQLYNASKLLVSSYKKVVEYDS